MYFECYRCNKYSTLKKSNIINHLSKKNKCEPYDIINIIDLNNNEILEKSLIPKYKKDESKENICNLCNKNFKSYKTLKFHQYNTCKLKIDKENNIEINNSNIQNLIKDNNIDTQNNINIKNLIKDNNIETQNIIETQIINNFQNPIFNINLIGFEEKWCLDHITDSDKKIISFCHFKYTTLLREILTNFVNLNVFIDKNTEQGYVYNNSTKNFEKMDKNQIIKDTIDKLHTNLIEINEEIKEDKNFYLDRKLLNSSKTEIETKYNNYNKENNNNKIKINKDFLDIYKNKDDETKKYYKINKKNIETGGF